MSQYLARLKEVESGKNFLNSPGRELTKPPKDTYVSFVSSVSEENKKISDIQSLQIEIVRALLHRIGEHEEDHFLVIDKCRSDPEVLEYFLKHARGEYEIIY